MPRLLLSLMLAVLGASAAAAAAPDARTPTVQALGLTVSAADVVITPKKGYAYLLWDAFPLRAALTAAAKARGVGVDGLRAGVAQALAEALVPAKAPGRAAVRVDIVEFPERDEYGQPLWSSVRKLQHLELELPGAKAGRTPAAKEPR